MLRSIKEIYNYVLQAEDGEIGRCKDFLFDDEHWTVRYMVVDTGKWLLGKKVLISPISLGEPDWGSEHFPVRLTKEQIEEAPGLDEDAPFSRQHEIRWTRHYGLPYYWEGSGVWGKAGYPNALFIKKELEVMSEEIADAVETHLRSAIEVSGYHIRATDDEIGHVQDFILDDETWTIRYMVVDTRNWLPGRKVLVAPPWINSVDWAERKVSIAMTRNEVENSPEYDPSAPPTSEYEAGLSKHYGLPIERGIGTP